MKYLFSILFIVSGLFLVTPVYAQEQITNFDSQIVAKKDGTMAVTETIEYDFGSADRHGIYRFIPLVSSVGDLYRIITVNYQSVTRDGKPEPYTVSIEDNKSEIKIGDKDKTISGQHTYQIKYIVNNGIGSNYDDHDEIYWNITGNEWNIPINRVTATVQTDFDINPTKAICFSGDSGSTEPNCSVRSDFVKFETTGLNSGQGLTIVQSYPVNTFPKSSLSKKTPSQISKENALQLMQKIFSIYSLIWLFLNFVVSIWLIFKYRNKPSARAFGPVTVNFDIPKDQQKQRIPPAEAGIIDNTILDQNDVTATIFDLAIRKYILLSEKKEIRKFAPDSTQQWIEKTDRQPTDLTEYETSIYNRLFQDGDKVKLDDLKTDFYKTFTQIEKEAFSKLKTRQVYEKNPKTQRANLVGLGMLLLFTGNIILAIVMFWLASIMNGRTKYGDQLNWQVDGLKLFLKNMSRHYEWQTKNLITVEKYIPYAIAFGYIDQFMEQLKVVYPDYQPTWYVGSSFYHGWTGFYSGFSSNLTTSAPSSSSGFSGGSSGGGGGGGGGGSW